MTGFGNQFFWIKLFSDLILHNNNHHPSDYVFLFKKKRKKVIISKEFPNLDFFFHDSPDIIYQKNT